MGFTSFKHAKRKCGTNVRCAGFSGGLSRPNGPVAITGWGWHPGRFTCTLWRRPLEVGNGVEVKQSTGSIIRFPSGKDLTKVLADHSEGFQHIWEEIPEGEPGGGAVPIVLPNGPQQAVG